MNTITPKQYAEIRKITPIAVRKAIREGHRLPGVKKIRQYGRFYLLELSKNFLPDNQQVIENKK